jgi:hypothetical protein
METTLILIIFLWIGCAAMACLAVLFLTRRRMTASEYIFWGLLALFPPVLGPFMVIISKPGKPGPTPPVIGQRR